MKIKIQGEIEKLSSPCMNTSEDQNTERDI